MSGPDRLAEGTEDVELTVVEEPPEGVYAVDEAPKNTELRLRDALVGQGRCPVWGLLELVQQCCGQPFGTLDLLGRRRTVRPDLAVDVEDCVEDVAEAYPCRILPYFPGDHRGTTAGTRDRTGLYCAVRQLGCGRRHADPNAKVDLARTPADLNPCFMPGAVGEPEG